MNNLMEGLFDFGSSNVSHVCKTKCNIDFFEQNCIAGSPEYLWEEHLCDAEEEGYERYSVK